MAGINNVDKRMLVEKNDPTETYFHLVHIILHMVISIKGTHGMEVSQ